MAVSIIVPAYNSEKFLAATLESVLAQTRGDWEVVVVNDGSTDQSGAIAETFARRDNRIRVVHQENAGLSGARNRGFAETRPEHEYCLFLDSDDLMEPQALEIFIQALERDPQAVAVHGLARYIDREGQPLLVDGSYTWPGRRRGLQGKFLRVWPLSAPTTFAVLAYACFTRPCAIMLRRAQKEIAGDFDPNISPCEDWDMWLRLSRLGDIAFLNRVVSAYRLHGSNLSKNRQLMTERELVVRQKMYHSADLDEDEKRLILLGYRYYELYRARIIFSRAARKLARGRWMDAFQQLPVTMGHILAAIKGDL